MPELATGRVEGRTLRKLERDVRTEAQAGRVRGTRVDGHLRRMETPALVKRALEALLLPSSPLEGSVVLAVPRGPGPAPLIPVHAVVVAESVGEKRRHGVRVFAVGTEPRVERDSRRTQAAFQLGMAAARVFDSFVLVFETREQATELARLVKEVGPIGVGVLWLDGDGQLRVEHAAEREAAPDLVHLPWGRGLRAGLHSGP